MHISIYLDAFSQGFLSFGNPNTTSPLTLDFISPSCSLFSFSLLSRLISLLSRLLSLVLSFAFPLFISPSSPSRMLPSLDLGS